MAKPFSKGQQDASKFTVALDDFPEFAAQVGVLISCTALIESYMHKLISKLTGISETDTFVISGSIGNFRPRIELYELLRAKRDGLQTK